MTKKITRSIFVLLCAASAVFGQQNDIKKFVGIWTGTYIGNGETQTASIIFKETDGKLSGQAESTEKADGVPMDLENIVVKGNSVKFEIMSMIKYEGVYKEENKSIEGVLTGADGNLVQLNLVKKIEAIQGASVKQFIGMWKANSGENEIIVLVINEKEGKLSGTIEIPEQNVGPFNLINLKADGNKLSFEIGEAAVAYSGTYDAAKKTITGIGIENEKATNIDFVKDEKIPVK